MEVPMQYCEKEEIENKFTKPHQESDLGIPTEGIRILHAIKYVFVACAISGKSGTPQSKLREIIMKSLAHNTDLR
jgi:hypothetical protein